MTRQKSSTSPTNTPDQPAAGKGMATATSPGPSPSAHPGQQGAPRDASAENTLELPRDRDEAVDMTSGHPSPLIEQAAKDIDEGLKDTSKAPEMDQTYKKLGKAESGTK